MNVTTEEFVGDSSTIYLHVTMPANEDYTKAAVTLFVSSSPENPPPMGSMVYSLPHRDSTVSTRLFQQEQTIDNAERLANTLSKKLNRPVIASVSGDLSVSTLAQIVSFILSIKC